jgi:mRNA interferase HigB
LRIIAKRTLRDFWTLYPDAEQQLTAWFRETEKANWQSLNDLKKEYPSASILKESRVVFNIKGNNYRLIVKFNLEYQLCWIRFIGTHAAYDKINAHKI